MDEIKNLNLATLLTQSNQAKAIIFNASLQEGFSFFFILQCWDGTQGFICVLRQMFYHWALPPALVKVFISLYHSSKEITIRKIAKNTVGPKSTLLEWS